jgi:hypothetical protein
VKSLNHRWRVSARSSNQGACVEARFHGDEIHLRDSKNRNGHRLAFAAAEWTAFIAGVKAGDFDRPGR